jgi:hypothetical protein
MTRQSAQEINIDPTAIANVIGAAQSFGQVLDKLWPSAAIILPDGGVLAIDALVAAMIAGNAEVAVEGGTGIPVHLAIVLLANHIAEVGTSDAAPTELMESQASFRDGSYAILPGSFVESGRVDSADDPIYPSPALSAIRRTKDKTVDTAPLRDVFVDGPPDSQDDVVRPNVLGHGGPNSDAFVEVLRFDTETPEFGTAVLTGNILSNDTAGTGGPPAIVSVTYGGTIYVPVDNKIIVEEFGVWRITIIGSGIAGQPVPSEGFYVFEHFGPFAHLNGGELAAFALQYTITDAHGFSDTSSISFRISDDVPVALHDEVTTSPGKTAFGNILSNDSPGADGSAGILEIVSAFGSASQADVDSDGRASVDGHYGRLVVNFYDGSFEYEAFSSSPEHDGEFGVDEFWYEIGDTDGDTAQARLTVLVVDGVADIFTLGEEFGLPGDGETVILTLNDAIEGDAKVVGYVDMVDVVDDVASERVIRSPDGQLESRGPENVEDASEVLRPAGGPKIAVPLIDLGCGLKTLAALNVESAPSLDEVSGTIGA